MDISITVPGADLTKTALLDSALPPTDTIVFSFAPYDPAPVDPAVDDPWLCPYVTGDADGNPRKLTEDEVAAQRRAEAERLVRAAVEAAVPVEPVKVTLDLDVPEAVAADAK